MERSHIEKEISTAILEFHARLLGEHLESDVVMRVAGPAGILFAKGLADSGANVIMEGDMGQRAQELFVANSIKVVIGAPSGTPDKLARRLSHRNSCERTGRL